MMAPPLVLVEARLRDLRLRVLAEGVGDEGEGAVLVSEYTSFPFVEVFLSHSCSAQAQEPVPLEPALE